MYTFCPDTTTSRPPASHRLQPRDFHVPRGTSFRVLPGRRLSCKPADRYFNSHPPRPLRSAFPALPSLAGRGRIAPGRLPGLKALAPPDCRRSRLRARPPSRSGLGLRTLPRPIDPALTRARAGVRFGGHRPDPAMRRSRRLRVSHQRQPPPRTPHHHPCYGRRSTLINSSTLARSTSRRSPSTELSTCSQAPATFAADHPLTTAICDEAIASGGDGDLDGVGDVAGPWRASCRQRVRRRRP
jgi:hypothetical protein